MPFYRIQVNVVNGDPDHWRAMNERFTEKTDAVAVKASLSQQWEGILEFRIIEIKVVE